VQGLANVLVVGGAALDRLEIAREFHREGMWPSGRFVAVDCCADPGVFHTALEAWLSGIPLDATRDLLRVAERGTLFLDRITCLPASAQRMLLELLQGLEAGEGRERTWWGRIVAGSAWALAETVGQGRFSRALEDALDKVSIHLPDQPPVAEPETCAHHREHAGAGAASPAADGDAPPPPGGAVPLPSRPESRWELRDAGPPGRPRALPPRSPRGRAQD
jgi:hypothetical protein